MSILFETLTILALSLIPAGFSYLLDFCLGNPGDHPDESGHGGINPKAIFFRWTYFLAERRLKGTKKYRELMEAFYPCSEIPKDEKEIRMVVFEQQVVDEGRKLFTWEMAFGMCIFCTGVWVSIFAGIIFAHLTTFAGNGLYVPIVTIIFSHGICRKLKSK